MLELFKHKPGDLIYIDKKYINSIWLNFDLGSIHTIDLERCYLIVSFTITHSHSSFLLLGEENVFKLNLSIGYRGRGLDVLNKMFYSTYET